MIQHFIITRFSIRLEYFQKKKALDPLRSWSLNQRFNMFEISCLPGILSQVCQDFTWLILVDPDLPQKYRDRLIQLVSSRSNIHIINYSPSLKIHQLNWLEPWIQKGTKYVLTTVIDDDDALCVGFVQFYSDYFKNKIKDNSIQPIHFFGCRNFVYWDFYYSKTASLGYKKQDNDKDYITGAGLTICAKYPEMNFSVMHFPHHFYTALANQHNESYQFTQPEAAYVSRINSLFKSAASQFMLGWDGILRPENFHIIERESPLVVILNHLENIQYRRIFINQEDRKPVTASESFKNFNINFTLAQSYILRSRKSSFLLIRLIFNHFLVFSGNERKLSFLKLMNLKLRSFPQIIKGYSKL